MRTKEYNTDAVRKYRRSRPDLHYARSKDYRRRNPEKYKAHNLVGYLLSKGKLERGSCEVCGEEKVQAHHEDYSKPLEIRWLCAFHHKQVHLGRINA